VPEITSRENPQFRGWLKLRDSSRERRKAGLSVLDGVHLVAAYLEHIGAPAELIVSRSRAAEAEIARLVAAPGMPRAHVLADGLFRELSSVVTPSGILAIVPTPRRRTLPDVLAACLMLEDIQDPGNLGSILRSAAAAGIRQIYLSRGCVHAWSPRVLRAGMGAHFALELYEEVDLAGLIPRHTGPVLAAARDAPRSLYSVDLRGDVAFLFGSEGAGLSTALRDAAHMQMAIPMPGKAESLNVAAAAAVCLFERVRQRASSSQSHPVSGGRGTAGAPRT
jgi:TrmH family RNA methyltransferase